MLTLDLVTIDTTGWKLHEHTPAVRSWYMDGADVVVRFALVNQPAPEITIEGWRARAERETTAAGGAWISFDEVDVDDCPGFRGIFKYPAAKVLPGFPSNSRAVYIVGMISVPLGGAHLRINTEALERGTTGEREAAFAVTQPTPSGEPQSVTMEEYFDKVRLSLARRLPSDDAAVDALAPSHPLSRVRSAQRTIVSGLRMTPEAKALARPAGV